MPNRDNAFLWCGEIPSEEEMEKEERCRSPLGAAAAAGSSDRQPPVRLTRRSAAELAKLTSSLQPTDCPSKPSEVNLLVPDATDVVGEDSCPRPEMGKLWQTCWMSEASGTETDASVAVDAVENTSPRAKKAKKRGRPPTTGKYVGLAQAKAELVSQRQREIELQAEQELAEDQRRRRMSFLRCQESLEGSVDAAATVGQRSLESLSSEQLEDSILKAVEAIDAVRSKSSNLNGQCKRDLRVACEAITGRVRVLRSRTANEEVVRLQAQLVEVRAELAAMKKVAEAAPAPMSRDEIGFLVDARLAGLEDRLMPKPLVPVRPPLRADVKKAARTAATTTATVAAAVVEDRERQASAMSQEPRASTLSAVPPSPPPVSVGAGLGSLGSVPSTVEVAPAGKRKKRKTAAAREAEASRQQRPTAPAPLPPVPPPAKEAWNKVAARKAPRPANPAAPATPAAAGVAIAAKPKRKRGARKLRAPTTAAVTLTLQPGAQERGITYSKVLAEAESNIDLKALGINGLRFRTAVTGGRILAVAGEDRALKADALAAKLKSVLSEEAVRIARPERCTELRISDLGDAVTSEKVAQALAEKGGCSAEAIKVGEIRRSLGRQGTAWVRCPILAAKLILKDGSRIHVGWSEAKLTTLDPRPARCFRCLEPGHVWVKCAAPDRSALCFQCGQAGHKAAACSSEPSCPACAAEGAESNHRIGSGECRTGAGKGKPKSKAGGVKPITPPTQQQSNKEVAMDTAN